MSRHLEIPAVAAGAALLAAALPVADARADGVHRFGIGLAHIEPRSSSGPLVLSEYGGMPTYVPTPDTGVIVTAANTLTLIHEYEWTDRVSTQLVLGLPPKHKLRGDRSLTPAGELGEGRQYSPTLLLRYHFGDPQARWRPFVGAGVNYTWYGQARITNRAFSAATYGPDARTRVSLTRSWNPAVTAGLTYRLDERWALSFSVAYLPVETTIAVRATNTADGVPVKVTTKVKLHTVGTALALTRSFDL